MRLGPKLVLYLTVPVIALTALASYLDIRRSRALLREELAKEGRAIARMVQLAMEDALRERQPEQMRDLMDQITGYERVLGLRLFGPDGRLIYQSQALEAYPFRHPSVLRKVLTGHVPQETYREIGDQPVVTFLFPILSPGGEAQGAFQLVQLESFIEEDARRTRRSTLYLTALMILATGSIIYLAARVSVVRPVEDLVRSFREIGAGTLGARIPVRRRDELGRLAEEFNAMSERLEESRHRLFREQEERQRMEARLRNADRLASLGRLAAGLAHEIGTPLNVIGGRAESLLRGAPPDSTAERGLRIIVGQIDRIARIVRGMLDFSRVQALHLEPTDPAALLRKVLDFLGHHLENRGIRVETSLPEGLPPLTADPDQLYQVFLNLTVNAMDAMPDGGTLRIQGEIVRTRHPERDVPVSGFLAIRFEDTGPGIRPDDLGRVFDPFFTTKEVGKGTGLGLSVSYGIVQEHGGWLDATSKPGHGAIFIVHLPLPGEPGAGGRKEGAP